MCEYLQGYKRRWIFMIISGGSQIEMQEEKGWESDVWKGGINS